MSAFLIYMLKSAVCLLLFYVFFKAFLSRDTFFRFNRFVLLGGMLVCLVLPSVHLEITGQAKVICDRMGELEKRLRNTYPLEEIAEGKESRSLVPEVVGLEEEMLTVGERTDEKVVSVAWGKILTGIYLLGAMGVCIWLSVAFLKIKKIVRDSRKQPWGKYTLVLTPAGVCPFSWGKYIVLSERDYHASPQEILVHEKVHADKGHTFDLYFTELFLIIQWFNPAIWLLKKELQEVHEYEADNGVLNQGIDATKYQLLLVKKAVGARLYSIANSFNHSKLKNRITMMLKEKSNRWARLKVLLLVPPTALLMLAFARPETEASDVEAVKVTQISEKNNVSEFVVSSDSLVQELEDYLKFEMLKRFTEEEKKDFVNCEPVLEGIEWAPLLMNRINQIAFRGTLVTIDKLPGLLEQWKKEKGGKQQPIYLYLKKDRGTSPQAWAVLLTKVKEFYNISKNEGPEVRVVFSEPQVAFVNDKHVSGYIVIYQDGKKKKTESIQSLHNLENKLNMVDYGQWEKVRINISPGKAGQEAKACADKIIKAKGWSHVTTSIIPPPPPPNPVIWLILKGEGLKDETVAAWNIRQFVSRLAEVKDLKQYTSFELKVKRQKNDDLKNQVLQKLREQGITDVKVINPVAQP